MPVAFSPRSRPHRIEPNDPLMKQLDRRLAARGFETIDLTFGLAREVPDGTIEPAVQASSVSRMLGRRISVLVLVEGRRYAELREELVECLAKAVEK